MLLRLWKLLQVDQFHKDIFTLELKFSKKYPMSVDSVENF